jgi:hypothetical protein
MRAQRNRDRLVLAVSFATIAAPVRVRQRGLRVRWKKGSKSPESDGYRGCRRQWGERPRSRCLFVDR